jgi:hypothetical protein
MELPGHLPNGSKRGTQADLLQPRDDLSCEPGGSLRWACVGGAVKEEAMTEEEKGKP